MTNPDLDAVDPLHRFVLLAVVELDAREEGPVHSYDVAGCCDVFLDEFTELETVLAGGITRQRVIGALRDLEETGLLSQETTKSPTGKGRPAYSLAVESDSLLDDLGEYGEFVDATDSVRESIDQ